jgi:hypothetical protein
MTTESLKDTTKRELPEWLRQDPDFRAYVMELTRYAYAPRDATQDRFYEMLAELRRDREEQTRKWEEQRAELRQDREDQARKWGEHARKWEEQRAELQQDREDRARKWDEHNRTWDEHKAEMREEFRRVYESIKAIADKHDRSIGALGSRWGLQSEKAFRDALAGILERKLDVQVVNVNEYDDEGVVFGRPDQVELDVIIKNGLLIICELKSSIDEAGMYSFERKARFYEKRHQRQANRLIVISPMIDARASRVAERLGIETYGDSIDVASL